MAITKRGIRAVATALALLAVAGCADTELHGSTGAGSHQGGYLGANAGADLKPVPPPSGDMRASPTAWCAKSTEVGRCRNRAVAEHEICLKTRAENYEHCRAAMHQMYTR